jgi:branched-chain amino acid transport system substrate-binding protein
MAIGFRNKKGVTMSELSKLNIAFILWVLFIPVASVLAENDRPPLKLGSILILTGQGSSWGIASKNGIEMAVEKLNSDGGILGRRIEVSHQDDQSNPRNAISAFRQLVDVEKVRFIIGPTWSNSGIPLIQAADKTKTIMISPSLGLAKFNEANKYLFNTWPHDFLLSEQLAEYVFRKGHRNIALVGAEDVWVKEQTDTFKRRFEELGGKIAFLTEPLPGTVDLRTEALKIKNNSEVEAVVSTTDGCIVGSLVAKELKQLGIEVPIFSITLDQSAIDASQGGFEGLEFLTFLTPLAEFQRAYEERFKIPIDIGADSAYDAVMMLAQAISEAGSDDTELVSAKLSAIKEWKGMSGVLKSDGRRGFEKRFAIKKVVNGKPTDF